MKNIHLLPTDKPSRLYFNEFEELVFTPKYEKLDGVNIYITSDEEIKDSYVINTQKNKIYFENWYSSTSFIKKIILTTDIDLIKDGVQAIDDEFLEWFVNNPSCDEIEVKMNQGRYFDYGGNVHITNAYKVIIPKEEPKPHSFCETPEEKCTMNYCDENGCQNRKRELVEPKQETLEEVEIRLEKADKYSQGFKNKTEENIAFISFLEGAKWQQEQQDEFAIGFAEWCLRIRFEPIENVSVEKLLEIYKKEQFKNK